MSAPPRVRHTGTWVLTVLLLLLWATVTSAAGPLAPWIAEIATDGEMRLRDLWTERGGEG